MATQDSSLNKIIQPLVEAMGFELWGLDFLAKGKQPLLRIYIEHPEGISVEDCADVSRQVGSTLDVEDVIPGQYTLEVSSPGMDRPIFTLEQYSKLIGYQAQVRLRMAFEGRRKFAGWIKGVEDGEVILQVEDQEYCFPFESIDKARILPRFDD